CGCDRPFCPAGISGGGFRARVHLGNVWGICAVQGGRLGRAALPLQGTGLNECSWPPLNVRPKPRMVVPMLSVTKDEVREISSGYNEDPARSMSLRSEAYTDQKWHDLELKAVFGRTWQWVCHIEKLTQPGSYLATTVGQTPIVIVRDRSGELRAFYNVCKHRAHELMSGSGKTRTIVCPYHAWTYDLSGTLVGARQTDQMET